MPVSRYERVHGTTSCMPRHAYGLSGLACLAWCSSVQGERAQPRDCAVGEHGAPALQNRASLHSPVSSCLQPGTDTHAPVAAPAGQWKPALVQWLACRPLLISVDHPLCHGCTPHCLVAFSHSSKSRPVGVLFHPLQRLCVLLRVGTPQLWAGSNANHQGCDATKLLACFAVL